MRPRVFETAQLELEQISVALQRAYSSKRRLPKRRRPLSRTNIILGLLVYLLGLALVGEVLVHHSAPPRSIVIDPAKPIPTPRYTKPGDQWFAELPDGRRVLATYVQDYSGQRISRWEDLPWTGNKIGDARYLWEYKHWFIWLAPVGANLNSPTWIDP